MATSKRRLPGIFVALSANGDVLAAWTKFAPKATLKDAEASAATSPTDQFVTTRKGAIASLTGFLGSEAPSIALGDEVTMVTCKEGANSVSQALAETTAMDICRCIGISENWQDNPADATWDWKWGYVDGDVDEGG